MSSGSGSPRSEPPEERESPLTHREVALAALVWLFFGALNAIAGHGTLAVSLHVASALGTLGAAALARAERPIAAFHLAAGIWTVTLAAYSIASGSLSEGALTLVLVPVLATSVASAHAGLGWLFAVGITLFAVRGAIAARIVEPVFTPTPTLREVALIAIAAVMWLLSERARRRTDLALSRLRRTAADARARADDLARLKHELEEKNAELDEVAERLAESAKEVAESNIALEEARDAAITRAKDAVDFLTRMSHEIRTPLNGVLGITDVLLGGKLDREARELVTIIESSGRVLRRLVDEVLDLARLDAGKLQLFEEPFDPLTVAEDVADLFAAQAHAKGVVLVTIAPEELPPRLLGDAMRVRQVLQNLVGNAVKFTARGHVRVDVVFEPGVLEYRVQDTGPGLSPAALGELFSEYAQAREGARGGGSGLGLVIARRLARAMGGDVGAESVLGRGSTFVARFALPRASTGRAPHTIDAELSGTITVAASIVRDPLIALALERTAAHANVQLVPVSDGEGRSDRNAALVFTEGPVSARHQSKPHVRLRAPSEDRAEEDAGLALLLPPRRTRVVRVTRQATGRVREPTASGLRAPPKGLSALVVDDEPVNRKVAALLLGREGWSVSSAATGMEALTIYDAADRVDAVLLDLDMPDLDGIETARALAQRARPGRRPWLVLQTASVTAEARQRARQAGVTDFLPKPFETGELHAVMLRAERHRRLEDRRALRDHGRPARDPATHAVVALVEPVADAIVLGETDVALAQLGELQALARRRQLDRIDRCCSALHDALLESDGLDALVELEDAVFTYAREASTDHGAWEA